MTPLYTSINALILIFEKNAKPNDELALTFVGAHLEEAAAAARTEIEVLAVEGLQETYDDMMSQSLEADKKALYELLQASVLSLQIQLIKEGQN